MLVCRYFFLFSNFEVSSSFYTIFILDIKKYTIGNCKTIKTLPSTKINPFKIRKKMNLLKVRILLFCILYASKLYLCACMYTFGDIYIYVCVDVCICILILVIYHHLSFSSNCQIIDFTIWSL